ncbi:MAG: substrate-binding domain-containing protein [Deltaproteobacteria bacterium]|nr:substrate-binding domain-containing protein [Deltaproteobacteria bacterium]
MAAFLKKIALLTGVALVLAVSSLEAAEPVAVIVNRANQVEKLSESEVKKIYTNNTLAWPDGAPIIIYDLSTIDPSRALFSERILGKSPDLVAEEWAHLKITNQAKNPPQTMKSPSMIIRRVMKEKGAIGYVSLSLIQNNPSVKVVNTLQ